MGRFKEKDPEKVKSKRIQIRVTESDEFLIQQAAMIRNLSVGEFCRRAALGRKADVKYDIQIVLTVLRVNQTLRDMYHKYLEVGLAPPEDLMAKMLLDGIDAMKRISMTSGR